jgi:branched-chain amino acid transport system permease protein
VQPTDSQARSSPPSEGKSLRSLSPALRMGLLGGIVALLLCLIGIVQTSIGRAVIYPFLSLGQTLLLLTFALFSAMAVRRTVPASTDKSLPLLAVAGGALSGLLISAVLAALVLIGTWINLRDIFIQASPDLFKLLTFSLPLFPGILALLGFGLVLGAVIGAVYLLPNRLRGAIVLGAGLIPLVAIVVSAFFAQRGLDLVQAIIVFVVGSVGSFLWSGVKGAVSQRIAGLPPTGQRVYKISLWVLAALVVVLLPLTGKYPAQVLDLVGLYVLMGLGLNIVVGFAGLLDLGYVAFFALGAYTMAVLTSPEIGWLGFHLTFWQALPFTVLVSTFAGVILGVPVLGMRGDYLAIVTLGFGEIIRLLVSSDWLKPYIGGSNGITRIPKPAIPLIGQLDEPGKLYYLIILGCLVVAFVAIRVKDSRLGRAWMALREDEDVAQAMGIDLVRTKLLAFATGAAFSGLAGAIFATMLTSTYPKSFELLVSINILSVIIVGGIGSIPGVVAGALALVGLPELLREFSSYRLWVFGAALVFMMLTRPEGLIPEARRKLELHESEGGE